MLKRRTHYVCHAKSQFGLATQMGVCACYTTRSLTGGIGGFNGARTGAFLNKHRQFPNRLDTGHGYQSLLRIFRSEGFSGSSRVVRFSARTLGLTSRSRVV